MKEIRRTTFVTLGIIIGSVVGLFLDIYQIDLYGAIGLGIVYTPMIGICLAIIIGV